VFHRFDGLAVGILIFIRSALADKLFAGRRVLALTQLGEVLGRYRSTETELCG
jgi:hypothetical protein